MKRIVQLEILMGTDDSEPPWRCEQCFRMLHMERQGDVIDIYHENDGTPVCDYTYAATGVAKFYSILAKRTDDRCGG